MEVGRQNVYLQMTGIRYANVLVSSYVKWKILISADKSEALQMNWHISRNNTSSSYMEAQETRRKDTAARLANFYSSEGGADGSHRAYNRDDKTNHFESRNEHIMSCWRARLCHEQTRSRLLEKSLWRNGKIGTLDSYWNTTPQFVNGYQRRKSQILEIFI